MCPSTCAPCECNHSPKLINVPTRVNVAAIQNSISLKTVLSSLEGVYKTQPLNNVLTDGGRVPVHTGMRKAQKPCEDSAFRTWQRVLIF